MKKQCPSVVNAPYHRLSPDEIVNILNDRSEGKVRHVTIKDIRLEAHPHVFPEGFRSTAFLLDSIETLVKDKRLCDMGCATGIVGLYALSKGAKKVVQADINHFAVLNAKSNRKLHKYTSKKLQIYESDCFDMVPRQTFDYVIFNIPFHTETFEVHDPLEYAFHDPYFKTLKKFLGQVRSYISEHSQIIIAFSNKGDVNSLEKIFNSYGFHWKLWKVAHKEENYDSRLYILMDPV